MKEDKLDGRQLRPVERPDGKGFDLVDAETGELVSRHDNATLEFITPDKERRRG